MRRLSITTKLKVLQSEYDLSGFHYCEWLVVLPAVLKRPGDVP